MSLKITIVLVIGAIAAAVVVYINPFKEDILRQPPSPWFYQVSMDDITQIAVVHGEESRKFFKNEERVWVFEDPANVPADPQRWGGMTSLLSGPRTRRLLSESAGDLAQYGLDNPSTIIDVRLTGDREIRVELGNPTPNGLYHYGKVTGFNHLYLINDSWGEVLTRLASEPPLPSWYSGRLPEVIVGLSLYQEKEGQEKPPELRFRFDDDEWWVSGPEDLDDRKLVDDERWDELLPILNGPPEAALAVYNVGSAGAPYGISKNSRTIEIRHQQTSQRGTKYTAKLSFRVGSSPPEGDLYYGQVAFSDYPAEPVLYLPSDWVDTLFGLFDDIPAAEVTEAVEDNSTG